MPLPLPKLDSRKYRDLVDEARALVPRQAPRWTDHNVHDPGITLIELFAWLTEMNVYRLDRTQEAAYRAFLRWVGIELLAAQAAETVLLFDQEPAGAAGLALPAGMQIATASADIVFQTVEPLQVSAARLVTPVTGLPFGQSPKPGDSLMLGFDRPFGAPGTTVSLYVWTGRGDADRETRRRLLEEAAEAATDATASCPPGLTPDAVPWQQHYSVTTVWEYFGGAAPDQGWRPLGGVVDETRALTLTGPIRFSVPPDQAPLGSAPAVFSVRCRIICGAFECARPIERIAINAAAARHAADIAGERSLGVSTGRAGQRFAVAETRPPEPPLLPIVPCSTRVRVLEQGVEKATWSEVAFWDLVGPHDRSYRLAPDDGAIDTGDGRVGWVPPAGAEIRMCWQVGGGPAGNVAAGALTVAAANAQNAALVASWNTVRPTLQIAQPSPAAGGASAETLASGQARAVAAIARADRAVMLADFELLARETPGVPVGRVHAVAALHPAFGCITALGCVMLVVFPDSPGPAPVPGPDFLCAVARYVNRRRTVATELHVVGPRYTRVTIRARLHAAAAADQAALPALAHAALDRFFNPLNGGPDGGGWPLGRAIYRTEVLALLAALPGVRDVDQLGIFGPGDAEPRCENLGLCPDGLVESGDHFLTVLSTSSRSTSR